MLQSLCRTAVVFTIATLLAFELTVALDVGSHEARAAEPVIVYRNINDGDVLGDRPFVLQFCFSEPINIKDRDKGGDFLFSLTSPTSQGLGLRIVFQPDGYGVGVYPGAAPSPVAGLATPTGEPGWTFSWRVVDAGDGTPYEETLHFTVDANADPIPEETPPPCGPSGGTVTPIGSAADATTTIRPTRTPTDGGPTDTLAPGETAQPTEEPGTIDEGDDDGPDVLLLALLTIGVVGAAGGVALIGFVLRKKIGYDPHKPGPGDSGHH